MRVGAQVKANKRIHSGWLERVDMLLASIKLHHMTNRLSSVEETRLLLDLGQEGARSMGMTDPECDAFSAP